MFQKRIRNRRMIFLAFCCVGLLFFSTLSCLGNPRSTGNVTPEIVENSSIPSAIDFSALWNRTYGGFDQDRFVDSTRCMDGGYAFVGQTDSFSSSQDIWVVRTNDYGDVLWTTTLTEAAGDDYGESIIECENGDFVIVGSSYPTGDYQARIDRLSSDGSSLWSVLIGAVGTQDSFLDVVEGSSGCLVAVGRTDTWGSGNDDVLAICFAPDGSEVWMRTYGGGLSDVATSIIECSDGGYAILGQTMSFGEGSLDFWLLRINNDGILLWEQTYGGSQTEYARDVIECIVGGFLMVGKSSSFGDIAGDYWAIKVNAIGIEDWNETYVGSGEDIAFGVIQAMKGGYTIVGCADFIGANPSARITRIDLDGTELWRHLYDGPNVDYAFSIEEVSPEEYVVGGSTNTYGSGGFDAWVFLVPGEPQLIDPPGDIFVEFGLGASASLWVESSTPIHMWWLSDTSEFDITQIGENEGVVYRPTPPDVGFYEIWVHVNNTAGHEVEHIFYIYVDDMTEPYWIDFTAEHTLEFGDQFQYTPRAGDLSFLGEWFLFGSSYFTIDINTGEISNVGTPPVGVYDFEITVGDMYHNTLIDDLQIVVQDTIAPVWDTALQDQNIEYGVDFVYDLNASDVAGIASWSVDNTEFSVDSEGRVRNLVTLAPGIHAVTVSVEDVNENVLQGQFMVTVGDRPAATTTTTTTTTTTDTTTDTDSSPGIFDSAIPFALGVVATIAVVAIVCLIGRRKPPAK